jgi:3-hydroxyisobutyrate dehydrogenase-like beta-hydroxyacid dehydrogenase
VEKSIGFIGLGNMGLPMAQNLLKAGFPLYVYNRNKNKASLLVKEGAKLANTPGDLLKDSRIVISMVSNDEALDNIVNGVNGLATRLQPGTVHLSMSTVSPSIVKKMKEEHLAKGAYFLSAPVTGRPDVAAAGKLWIFLAGEKNAKQRVRPLLEVLSQGIFDLGEEAEHANIFKLINNFMITSSIEALGEAFALGEKHGLSPKLVGEVLTESQFACPIYKVYAPLLAKQTFDPAGFTLELGFKDLKLLKEQADESFVVMPFLNYVFKEMQSCMESGLEKKDWSIFASQERRKHGS